MIGNRTYALWMSVALLLISRAAFAESSLDLAWQKSEWIGYTKDDRKSPNATRAFETQNMKTPKDKRTSVSPLLRKTFQVEKPVRSVQIMVCGLGLHELYLNGQKVGDRVLDPAPTSYDKRAFYTVHDVTALLQQGQNAIGLMLGNGFYGQDFAFTAGLVYGKPRAKLLLAIEYSNGSKLLVPTGTDWLAAQGPIVFDNIYAGETYDARLEVPDWSTPDFDDSGWSAAEKMDVPTANLVEQRLGPMRNVREVKPVAILPAENGEWIIDMGENMTGWLQLRTDAPKGTRIQMRFAELLMPNGKAIDTASTGVHATGCEQMDVYICKGGGESWEPRFTYHGFRYVQVKGVPNKPTLNDFTGWFVRTDMSRTGSFECSDPMLNKFYEVSLRTIEGNVQGLLSDCPHRERCAWLGDMHAVAEAICMNYDAQGLWSKHTEDFGTVLGVAGPVPRHYPDGDRPKKDPRAPANIACGKRLCGQARPDWGMAVVLVPWFNWLYHGDQETAENAWPMMSDYMDYLSEHEVRDDLIKDGYAYGDWCPPGSNREMDTSPQLSASALYYRSAKAMRQMARLMGKSEAEKEYAQLAERVKTAFNDKFLNRKKYEYGSQTATAMALNTGLAPEGKEAAVAAGLNRLIMGKNKGHYATGIMGHRHLYTSLNDYGFGATSAKLWGNTNFPSLAFLTEKHDLTTWPETPYDWPKGQRYRRNSFSHPMHSGFAVTFHESIGGIRPDTDYPGFERFILKPCFLPGLDWAKVEYDSAHGKISSHWKRSGNRVVWGVMVPEGTSARIELPSVKRVSLDGKAVKKRGLNLDSGRWQFEIVE